MKKIILLLFFIITARGFCVVQQLQSSTSSVSSLILTEPEALTSEKPSDLFNCSWKSHSTLPLLAKQNLPPLALI